MTVLMHAATASAQHLIADGSLLAPAALLYYAAVAGLLVCYAAVMRCVDEAPSRRTWLLIVAVPLVVQIGWVLTRPVLAIDAYSYLVDAAHAHAGLNPYQHAVKEAAGTDFGRAVVGKGRRRR